VKKMNKEKGKKKEEEEKEKMEKKTSSWDVRCCSDDDRVASLRFQDAVALIYISTLTCHVQRATS
jgi:hypothetical protein